MPFGVYNHEMKILSITNNQTNSLKNRTNFCSRNFPIKPFTVQTKNGPIHMREMTNISDEIEDIFNFHMESSFETTPGLRTAWESSSRRYKKNIKIILRIFAN